MSIFLYILLNNITPLIIIIFLGFVMGKKFNLSVRSFSKLNFYILIPAMIFVKIYETELDSDLIKVLVFTLVLLIILDISSRLIAKLFKFSNSMDSAFRNSVMFYNSGNFGLPLVTLVFQNSPYSSYAVSVQIMVLMIQSLFLNTLGFYNVGKGKLGTYDAIKMVLKMPTLYAILSGFLLKFITYDMHELFLWPSIDLLKDAAIPVALFTLGVQLSLSKIHIKNKNVYISVFTRLILGPIIAYGLILIFGFNGLVAQVLLISSSVPSTVNSVLIAVEFDNEPDFAAQTVLISTILCSITLTIIIYLSKILF
ncbi:MAG: AEC family transporter [Clostridiaceae bacterium]